MTLPSRMHAIVLVSKIHKPTLRAVSYARAMRPTTLEAVTVDVDPDETRALQREWDRRGIPVPLKVLDSPYREITRPVLDYVRSIRRTSPRDVVTVYIPEYVVGHWWEHLLHNQSALRLKGRLLFTPGVMVTSVPWQLRSSAGREDRPGGRSRPAPAAAATDGRGRRTRPTPQPPRGGVGRRRVASRSTSARSRTAGTAWRATRAGSSSSGTRCRASGCGSRSPRARPPRSSGGPTRSRCSSPSPDRVAPPCPWAGPGRCGGCDWQHAALPAQRALKAAVVREQLAHLAGIERDVVVEAVPGDDDGLGWRTRVHYAVDAGGPRGSAPAPLARRRAASTGAASRTRWSSRRGVPRRAVAAGARPVEVVGLGRDRRAAGAGRRARPGAGR